MTILYIMYVYHELLTHFIHIHLSKNRRVYNKLNQLYIMSYLEEVMDDITDNVSEYLSKEEYENFESADDFAEYINENMWDDDHVTGNGSGSYTFNRENAKENILADDFETIDEAIQDGYYSYEDLGKDVCNAEWEGLDVICRCFVLYQAARRVFDEHPEYDFS